jgi:hypothetical protein
MYADYSFYTGTYGGSLGEGLYRVAERRAEAYIRYLTYVNGDIFAVEGVTTIQMAVCAAAEVVASATKIDGSTGTIEVKPQVSSENIDGYSVTYAAQSGSTEDAETELRKKVLSAIRIYLLPTGWLSRKVRCGCDHECGCDCI